MEINIHELRQLCLAGSIQWTAHALKRLLQRGITQAQIKAAILEGEIIEQYPDDYPFPSCLVLGNALHVVCGVGDGRLWVITAYVPDPDEWGKDLKVRR